MYAVFAAGIVASLLLLGHLSDRYGRRTALIPALLTGLVAALMFATSTRRPPEVRPLPTPRPRDRPQRRRVDGPVIVMVGDRGTEVHALD
ncbi:hypothetical protein EV648_102665 [Kribbella sp. VKM Ac-2568]|nr:hypothetical protein EV648_102665 [Kribbella sp. VKM Ac-2568]